MEFFSEMITKVFNTRKTSSGSNAEFMLTHPHKCLGPRAIKSTRGQGGQVDLGREAVVIEWMVHS